MMSKGKNTYLRYDNFEFLRKNQMQNQSQIKIRIRTKIIAHYYIFRVHVYTHTEYDTRIQLLLCSSIINSPAYSYNTSSYVLFEKCFKPCGKREYYTSINCLSRHTRESRVHAYMYVNACMHIRYV